MRKLLLAALFTTRLVQAACSTYPAAYDLQRVEYSIEKLSASLRIVLEFPKLSAHPNCESRAIPWGTLWEFGMDLSDPVKVKVYDLNKTLVQEFSIYGPMDLRVTSTRATFRFYSALVSKNISDHRILSIELWDNAPLRALPAVEVEEAGARRMVSGAVSLLP